MTISESLAASIHAINPQVVQTSIDALSSEFSRVYFERNEPLLQQGNFWNQAFLVKSGLIRMHFLRPDGREFNKNFFAEGALLCPLTPAMWSEPSLFGINCIEPSEIWCCPIDTFKTTLLPAEWQEIQRQLLMRLLDGKLQREHDLLTLNGKQRYEKFCRTQAKIADRVPLLHLASYLGMTDVSLSRLRRQM